MSTPTRSAGNSLSKDSRVLWSSHAGARLRVNATPGATSVVVDSVGELTGTALYASSTPGQLMVLSCAAGPSHVGKTADVNTITGTTLTVDVDFSAILAAGDIIAVLPPPSVELFLNQGHTLNASLANDYTKGLTETFDTHNTPLGVEVGGDVPFFQILTSEGFARILAAGIGAYKTYRTVTDGVTNSGDATLTSATAAFTAGDVGEVISGTGIPANTTIASVTSATEVEMSATATATATGVSVTVGVQGTHKYRPIEANDGSYTELEDATVWAQDGNGVVRQAFFGLFGTTLALDYPENASSTGSISLLGNGAVREIGGSGKTFTTGANNYIRNDLACDTGPRITFRSAFVELGGTFGAGLTSAAETSVKNLQVRINRGAINDRTLGDAYIVKPEEQTFEVMVTGTRIQQTDAYFENAWGGATDAEPGSGAKTETRMLIKAVSPNDPTKTLTLDMPRGVFSTHTPRRQPGRFLEDFEFRVLATLSSGCVSTSVPPLQAQLVSSVTKQLASQI